MNVLQKPLFPFEEILSLEPEKRLQKIFITLDNLPFPDNQNTFRRGPKGYSSKLMLRALLAMKIYSIPTIVLLVERLKSDFRFRYSCGFSLSGSIPSEATFSRFLAGLAKDQSLYQLFLNVVTKGRQLEVIDCESLVIDSTVIHAYEKKCPKKEIHQDGTKADWGSKKDSKGNQLTWFGYKLHLAVDPKSECPVDLKLTPASVSDGELALPFIKELAGLGYLSKYYIMDAGYDWNDIYQTIFEVYKGQAIIPLNPRNEKQPPTGLDFDGTPICSAGYRMIYWGDGKFRCPHILGKVDCPFGSNWCSSSNYGHTVKIKVKDDPRRFSSPHRNSRNWIELYHKRTAVERVNGRLKDHLGLEIFKVQGIEKVLVHMLLSNICLVSGTIAINLKGCRESAA
jgi:transposase, IS5 family